jgi:CheY-like chemotaxis protein
MATPRLAFSRGSFKQLSSYAVSAESILFSLMTPSKTILIAEDSESDHRLLVRSLKNLGVINPIQIVQDGMAAIHYLAGLDEFSDRSRFPIPSILFLDLKLPKSDGLEVLNFIASHLPHQGLLKIALTGVSDRMLIDQAYALGANSFLRKPIRMDDLQGILGFFKDYWTVSKQSMTRTLLPKRPMV